jgi:hypothetical protein
MIDPVSYEQPNEGLCWSLKGTHANMIDVEQTACSWLA